MALTGEKLNGVEMIACGLATHYVLKEVSITLCALNIPEICSVLNIALLIFASYRGFPGLKNGLVN